MILIQKEVNFISILITKTLHIRTYKEERIEHNSHNLTPQTPQTMLNLMIPTKFALYQHQSLNKSSRTKRRGQNIIRTT